MDDLNNYSKRSYWSDLLLTAISSLENSHPANYKTNKT